MAWWQAVPEPAENERDKNRARKSRLDLIGADAVPHMPSLEPGIAYLYETLQDMGVSKPGAMGAVPLEWVDLQAWEHGTGIELQPWEARLIRRLSVEYIAEGRRAEARDAQPPWAEVDSESRRVADSMRDDIARSIEDLPQSQRKRR